MEISPPPARYRWAPPYLTGTHLATHQVVIEDAAQLCAKIRAYD